MMDFGSSLFQNAALQQQTSSKTDAGLYTCNHKQQVLRLDHLSAGSQVENRRNDRNSCAERFGLTAKLAS